MQLRMTVHPGREAEFEQVWHRLGGIITEQPANLGQTLSRSVEEESVYYIVSDWTSEEEFREYERSERHVEHRKQLHPYRSAGSMTTMRVVHELR
ncbi:antibiotic biosynthesis monooxygenase family protein [Amycolatopsis sp. A133]|uniref:antibiotic biosynthesis monooxygenase family protein n=1 Tax=Amycolatopsis sp. A133 TaxID=3064472 RepID=UPI0027F7B0B8|nr:antibiotic biosynthesis monooxygenase family protein [Amycolatopsis sp. A133]MDQ7803506.1 antibiotic biosynthesis monooxygenase family protein [Amycolatopsis sp. A133]